MALHKGEKHGQISEISHSTVSSIQTPINRIILMTQAIYVQLVSLDLKIYIKTVFLTERDARFGVAKQQTSLGHLHKRIPTTPNVRSYFRSDLRKLDTKRSYKIALVNHNCLYVLRRSSISSMMPQRDP